MNVNILVLNHKILFFPEFVEEAFELGAILAQHQNPNEPNLEMYQKAKQMKMKMIDVEKDGNCLFHVIRYNWFLLSSL